MKLGLVLIILLSSSTRGQMIVDVVKNLYGSLVNGSDGKTRKPIKFLVQAANLTEKVMKTVDDQLSLAPSLKESYEKKQNGGVVGTETPVTRRLLFAMQAKESFPAINSLKSG
mgnify:CR=1 FL=1